jgi:ABC-type transporter Mla MlaB component
VISEAVTTLQDLGEGEGSQSLTTLELSGQLSGDISALLGVLDSRLGEARLIHISCALLIRVDFIAAGDLLNWVIAKRAEGRQIRFTEVHRLVALMFRAMGIIEHAPVQLRQV